MWKILRFFEFIYLLRVEPYLFALTFVYTMKRELTEQLVADKICRFTYNLTATYCQHLHTMLPNDDPLDMRHKIMADKKQLMLYKTAMIIVPSLMATVIVGHWTDTYIKAKKWLLMTGALAIVAECLILILNDYYFDLNKTYILIAYVPGILSGGLFAVLTAIWPYIAVTTPTHYLTHRIACAEIINMLAQALGIYGGAHILNTTPMFNGGQLHNYSGVFTIAGTTLCLAFIWAALMVDKKRDTREWERRFGRHGGDSADSSAVHHSVEHRVNARIRHFLDKDIVHPLKRLFNIKNGHKMLMSLVKRRDNYLRFQILILFLSVISYVSSNLGPIVFGQQFSQRAYRWTPDQYVTAFTLGCLAIAGGAAAIGPILLGLRLKDTHLALLGLVSFFSLHLIRGIVVSPNGYYYSLIPGCLGLYAIVGIRAHLYKLFKDHELGKVLSFFAATEATTPLIATEVINIIFDETIGKMQGLPFIIIAVLLVIPFMVIVWIDNYTILPHLQPSVHSGGTNNNAIDVSDYYNLNLWLYFTIHSAKSLAMLILSTMLSL
ncbi:unnamed protein product [Medioppia subpectinata]|uniref:Adenylate cyclase n=1 Tax=Medioppia subpectinata TaxID=1979941 RepID=A0A7R9KHY5_9ACAR|nr:unnamed protein product [Medioppia subpectinata]CAG2103843.1 unnamed protein product [Medioppia subpectinata]